MDRRALLSGRAIGENTLCSERRAAPDLFESTVFLLIAPAPLDGQRLVVMIGTTLAMIVPQSLGIFAYPRRGAAFMRRWSWRRRTHRVSKPPSARADASSRFATNLCEYEIEASVSGRSRLRQGRRRLTICR